MTGIQVPFQKTIPGGVIDDYAAFRIMGLPFGPQIRLWRGAQTAGDKQEQAGRSYREYAVSVHGISPVLYRYRVSEQPNAY
jgi:hypothetical protein